MASCVRAVGQAAAAGFSTEAFRMFGPAPGQVPHHLSIGEIYQKKETPQKTGPRKLFVGKSLADQSAVKELRSAPLRNTGSDTLPDTANGATPTRARSFRACKVQEELRGVSRRAQKRHARLSRLLRACVCLLATRRHTHTHRTPIYQHHLN